MQETVTFREALRFWWKLGWISFGGPTGQIALMHTEVVERRRWINEPRFLHALNYCMLLPGPEAQQLATYLGWMMHGTRGAIAAGVLFVLPSALLLWALSWIYAAHGQLPWVAAIFAGFQPVVMAIVAQALTRIGAKALKRRWMWFLAAAAFVSLSFLHVPFPLIIASAALLGALLAHFAPGVLSPAKTDAETLARVSIAAPASGSGWRRAARVLAVCLVLWWLPVGLLALGFGRESTFVHQGLFFSQAALVTFGGAYAVLPYVAQTAVEHFGWLSSTAMLDGLGLAETTPGPLIMVLQFVGFLGGWNQPEGLPPWLGGLLGAAITTWVTFVPCFLWILLGAPHVEALRGRRAWSAALSCVTAAVVGVVANLAVWFGRKVLWGEAALSLGGLDVWALAVAVLGFVALVRFKLGVVHAVLAGGLIGWLRFGFFAQG